MPHRARPRHEPRHPVHVTLRAGLRALRAQSVFAEIRRALALGSRSTFRIVHFSVQTNHIHLIVEAHDKQTLSSGVRGLVIRAARGINRAVGRQGRVWADRYHARALGTPREVRNALVYVLLNRRKHSLPRPGLALSELDPCSSAAWFDGWKTPPAELPSGTHGAVALARGQPPAHPAVARARTWLARIGWRRHGLLRSNEAPKTT